MKYQLIISKCNFLKTSLATLLVLLVIGCATSPTNVDFGEPRLTTQLRAPNQLPTKGLTQLDFGGNKDGILYVPESYSPDNAMPLLIAMHGAGGSSSDWKSYHARAESRGMIFMALDSRSYTWDLILGGYGDDLQLLDRALKYVFKRCNIDPTHIAICGFSDGASYALSLGISNGDLFSHLIGYSPGFVFNLDPIVGTPQIYVSHGTQDTVLPVEVSRDNIVPTFINNDYDVFYDEFEGGHQVPATISEAALDWYLGPLVNDPVDEY